MFGYACNEAPEFMPAPIYYSHRLVEQQAKVRKNGKLKWLRPDAKSQVTLRYDNAHKVIGLDAVVLSTQHDPGIKHKDLVEGVYEHILKPVLPKAMLEKLPKNKIHINPTGIFVIGGPVGDCGLTGRKIIVDTYGGMARHGGGAFSGKDPSKVDRSAAYAARYVAKNIVAAGLADKCEVQVSYAIGVAEPTSISVTTFGTGKISDDKIEKLIRKPLRPAPVRHRQDARPDPPDVPVDRGLRPFRPQAEGSQLRRRRRQEEHRDRVLVGKDRQGRRTAQGRRPEEVSRAARIAGRSDTGNGPPRGPFSLGRATRRPRREAATQTPACHTERITL